MIIRQVTKWSEYERVILDEQGQLWRSARAVELVATGMFYGSWGPWKQIVIDVEVQDVPL